MKFHSLSIAAHSTFNWCPDFRFMIDCGEGLTTLLGMGVATSVKKIFLTHDHMDHVAGLLNLLHLRQRVSDLDRLTIYYPADSGRLDAIRAMGEFQGQDHAWHRIDPGERVLLTDNGRVRLYATTFPVLHAGGRAVGYQLHEIRRKLRGEFAGLSPQKVVAEKIRREADDLCEDVDFHLLSYTGDTAPLEPAVLGRPRTLFHDATFPAKGLGDDGEHSTWGDAQNAAVACGGKLIANHLSLRYRELEPPTVTIPQEVRVVPYNGTVGIFEV